MQVRPQDAPIHVLNRLQQMVVVVPVDAYKNKTEQINQQGRDQGPQSAPVRSMRDLDFQHHDRDYDGDHAIAECFHPPFFQPNLQDAYARYRLK